MDVSTRAVITAALATLVAAAAYFGDPWLVGAAVGLTLLVAAGWPVLLGLPNPVGSGVVVALSGGGAVLAVAATQGHPLLRDLPVVLALAVLLAFVNELARQDGRLRLVESVTGTVSGVLIVTAAAGWVAAGRSPGGSSLVVSGAVALAVAAAVSAVPLGGWLAVGVTAGAGTAGGAVVAAVMPRLDALPGAVLGLAAGILVAALHVLYDSTPARSSRLAALAALSLPVSVSGFVVYVVGRVLAG